VHEIIAKLARFAVSKAAAFCYAVAVGVAGNLAFNLVQQHRSPATVTPPPAVAASASTSANDGAMPPGSALAPLLPAGGPVATAPILPQPAATALPGADALPPPVLRPAALPPREPAAAPAEPAVTAALPAPPPAAAERLETPLPPIGQPIDVSPPPTAPAVALPREPEIAMVPREPAAAAPEKPASWALSDLWHPTRAVAKGIHWAGEQLPIIGGDAEQPRVERPPVPAPIPLLPRTATAPASPGRPGPGSGGLY